MIDPQLDNLFNQKLLNPKTFSKAIDQLHLIEMGGNVNRYHTMPTIHTETVGHHSFLVASLLPFLAPEGRPSVNVLLAALQHDVAEYITGDLPAPTKIALGIREQFATYEGDVLQQHSTTDHSETLTPEETRMLKMADNFAGLLFCFKERFMGNQFITRALDNYTKYIEAALKDGGTVEEHSLFQAIKFKYRL